MAEADKKFSGPAADELEVSVFGPGVGEAIAVHVGNGTWIAIDSCRQPGEDQPAVLEYLMKIGVNCATDVRLLVATHWHDDHIKGLAEVLDTCKSARFACSNALTSREFLTLLSALGHPARVDDSGINEFRDALDIIQSRQSTPILAQADRLLLRGTSPINFEVHSLSPSDASVTRAIAAIGSLLPKAGDSVRYPIPPTPNEAAIAIWVRMNDLHVLLGSDLEVTGDSLTGWTAILATELNLGKALMIKVPHHGSPNGDHPGIWDRFVGAAPTAIVSPFLPSRRPRADDLERLKKRTPAVFVTSKPTIARPPRRNPAVERTLREVATHHRVRKSSPGHVRFRIAARPGAQPQIDLFGSAFQA